MESKIQSMYEYYLSQPEYMARIMNDRSRLLAGFAKFYAGKRPDRVYLVGSGTSLNACEASREYMEHILGVEVSVFAPSAPPVIHGGKPLVIMVSQSGKSTNSLAFLQGARERGLPVATFTAGVDVPVAMIADCAVDLGVGNETAGPKTRGYTCSVLCLYLAALEAARESGRLASTACGEELALLQETIDCAEENLKRCDSFYRRHLETLKGAAHYLFVGKGCAAAVAKEAALKVLETLCFPAAGYEFEEYLHGPACCTEERTALFLFLSGDGDAARMEKLAGITAKASKNSYIIDRVSGLGGENVLRLRSAKSKYMSPFVDIYFAQLISARLTQELGRSRHEAVREIFADMDTKVVDDGKSQQTAG